MIDATALSILLLTNLYSCIDPFDCDLFISEGTLLEFKRVFRSLSSNSRTVSFSWYKSRSFLMKGDADQNLAFCNRFSEFIKFCETRCHVESGFSLSKWKHESRATIIDCLGRPALESIAIAKDRSAAIWTDDIWIGLMAESEFNVRRVWTDCVFLWLQSINLVSESQRSQMAVELAHRGYSYTKVNTPVIQWAGETDQWLSSGKHLGACIEWLERSPTNRGAIVKLALNAMGAVYECAPNEFLRTSLITRIFSAIGRRTDGHLIHQMVRGTLASASGIDKSIADGIAEIINQWDELCLRL